MPLDRTEALALLNNLEANLWTDRGTRVVAVDFNLCVAQLAGASCGLSRLTLARPLMLPWARYNTNSRLLTVARVRFEFFPNAHLQTSFKFFSFRILVYSSRTDMVHPRRPQRPHRGTRANTNGVVLRTGPHGVRNRVLLVLGIPRAEGSAALVPPCTTACPVRSATCTIALAVLLGRAAHAISFAVLCVTPQVLHGPAQCVRAVLRSHTHCLATAHRFVLAPRRYELVLILVALIIILEWLSFVRNPLRTDFDVNSARYRGRWAVTREPRAL